MTTPQLQAEAVKSAITNGNATSSTLTTLQSLLSAEIKSTPPSKVATTQPKRVTASKKTTTTKRPGSTQSHTGDAVGVHQDNVQSLSPKERYSLATEVVNITLKNLTETLKSRSKPPTRPATATSNSDAIQATPRKLSRTSSSTSRTALQPRSGNSTPVAATPIKSKTSPVKASSNGSLRRSGPSSHISATGECSRLAFSFLRSANTKQLGVKELPPFQLENGMLALSGKLLSHGLESLAIKELRIVKGRLEAVAKTKPSNPPERTTLATLLLVQADFIKRPDILPIVITYQSLVLRAIALSSKPATIEASIDYLGAAEPLSPAVLIRLHGEQSGDKEKAGRLSETLSSTILGLCPSLSSSADQIAVNREASPAPEAVLRLQSIGLQIRRQWWALVQHQPNLEKELFDPALRCISAFVRRTRKSRTAQQIYDAVSEFVQDAVSDHETNESKSLLAMHRTLTSLAEETGKSDEVKKWSAALDKQSQSLESNHAQRISTSVRQLSKMDAKAVSVALPELVKSLRDTIAGSSSDHEGLLADLSRLLPRLPKDCGNDEDMQQLVILSAAFTLRFIRSYPGKGLSAAQAIIQQALRQSTGPDAGLSWINNEAVQILVDTGALDSVSKKITSSSSGDAWSSSAAAITLGRALRLLVVRAVKSNSSKHEDLCFDNERLGRVERGVMLEWQLGVAFEHAPKSKYHAALQTLIPQLLQKLDQVYSSTEHPLRRANLAVQVLRFNAEHPAIITQQATKAWEDTELNTGALLQDYRLGHYAEDISLALRLAKIVHAGRPSFENLSPLLSAWQRILDEVSSDSMLKDRVYDPAALRLSLRSTAAFFGALGEDTNRLAVLTITDKLDELQAGNPVEQMETSILHARQWLSIGCSEKAGTIFAHSEKHLSSEEVPVLTKVCWHLAYAEYLLAIDNLDKCKGSLEAAHALRERLPPKQVSRDQRAAYEMAHGEGWLLMSKYGVASGAPHDALAAAKHAVKIVNSAWSRLEKDQASETSGLEETTETSDTAVAELATGVSKLQLVPKNKNSRKEPESAELKGAAFWPLVPLLCRALMYLSDMYAHHGLFSEANYYSEKAVEIAKSMGPSALLSRVRSHRAILFALAGKIEDAELCLVGGENADISSSPLALIERLRAQAALRARDGAAEEAVRLYEEAALSLSGMQTDEWMLKMSRFETEQPEKVAVAKPPKQGPAARTGRTTAKSRKATDKPVPVAPKPTSRSKKVPTKAASIDKSFYILQKMRAGILFERALLSLDISPNQANVMAALAPLQSTITGTLKQRQIQYRQLLDKATAILQTDIAYNILLDSTLSIPALLWPAVTDGAVRSASPSKKTASTRTNARTGQRKAVAKPDFKSILAEAHGCLLAGQSSISRHCTSAEAYTEGSNLLDVSVLCASVDATVLTSALHTVQTGLTLDFPRINALQLEQSAALADANHETKTGPFEWPSVSTETHNPQLNAADFQEQYINIIPKPWTAVSIALDESCTSLYVARYRADQTPFIVRLPFSRHQDEELGNEAFDYAAGKDELQDIIQLSNTSCHNNIDLSAKGAKSNWWSEREALDRRLQELLINIEDMWFGGFKGVFSPRARQHELLARFRTSFEASLDRHLPSRQAMKGRAEKLALDHNVLELFVNLGSDNDGAVDLDEPISDLLYFVVDMLQFNGERNAYDEIDFDEMTVEVLDALRSYHEAIETDQEESQHVVLVLDKRLQAFPWENLPCLENVSVSRVGSMLSLRDCITAMQTQRDAEDRYMYMVSRKSGAFILNPSADLTSTQSTLLPALSKAAAVDGADWSSIVNRAPSEEDFKSTLENSSLTLYFGHGAGSQYIRPRTIKKLERCSEVVWLMGCSSGAVTEYGELEPQAVPLAYLNTGTRKASSDSAKEDSLTSRKCLSIVATLWDVTDKDIDRFSLTIGEQWGLWSAPPTESAKIPAKTPKKRERLVAPSTPQKAPKTPKTPKVVKTPAAAKTPARSRSRSTAGDRRGPTSLASAVARSRDACYLRYLNGAAPVVYGVPVYLGD